MRTGTKRSGRAAPPRARHRRPATELAYVERVNRAIDHVVRTLAEPLRLGDVARVAQLSPFHFHRVFHALVGETLAEFVKRLRLDRALVQMTYRPRRALGQIASACGFASASDFSRCFKQRFGAAPSAFDLAAWRAAHLGQLAGSPEGTNAGLHLTGLPAPTPRGGLRVQLRTLPARSVAYIRVRNPYAGGVVEAAQRLVAWAERHGLAHGAWLGYQWDNPEIVPPRDCHYHVAVVADRFVAAGEIGRFRFPAMTVAQVEVRGDIEAELGALRWLYGTWLPRSGYVPDDQPCFEAWIGRPFALGLTQYALKIELPVRRG